MNPTLETVRAALEGITDPCSVGSAVPLSIYEMGLVEDIRIAEDGKVTVRLRLSSPGCMMGGYYFEPLIARRLGEISGVTGVALEFGDPLTWTEESMSTAGRAKLAAARLQRKALVPASR